MNIIKRLTISWLLIALLGCSPFNITTDYNPDLSVSDWKHFQWQLSELNPKDPYDNDLSRQRVVEAINHELANKGFKLSQTDSPDFYIDYFFLVEPKTQVRQIYNHHCAWGGCRYNSYDTYTKEYKYGSIVVSIIEAKSKLLQWRGIAGSRISEGASPEQRKQNIETAIHTLFQQFPPPVNTAP